MAYRTRFSDRALADMLIQLIGEIEPVGETQTDEIRFDNLIRLQNTVDLLLEEIMAVCPYADRPEYSMMKAGEQAVTWFEEKQAWVGCVLPDKPEVSDEQ